MCGSFCTHAKAMEALEQVKARFERVVPIVSQVVADTPYSGVYALRGYVCRIFIYRRILHFFQYSSTLLWG